MYKKSTEDLFRIVMRISLTVFLLTTVSLMLHANSGNGQSLTTSYVEISFEKIPLEKALKELQRVTQIDFAYDRALLAGFTTGPVTFKNERVDKVLNKLFENKPFVYSELNGVVVVSKVAAKITTSQPGTLTGQVIDETGKGLPGATVLVKNTMMNTATDVEGKYSLRLEPGTYEVEFRFTGYQPQLIQGVIVTDNERTSLNIAMKVDVAQLGEVVITSSFAKASVQGLLAKQKNSAAISDGISAEQIRITPDNNAAQVLKRVSGLTIQEDKFVTVRGLSDRYNNVILNGSSVPSTEPNRRNFSFDIIPSALIDNIVVNKTATPDMPSEFAGGTVQVNTRDLPDSNYFQLGIGAGYNTNTAGRKLFGTHRGSLDYVGYDDGDRYWWKNKWDRFEYGGAYRANDRNAMSEMNQRIPNHWGLRQYTYTPMQNYQVNAGKRFALRTGDYIGLTGALIYRHEEQIHDEERRTNYGNQYDFTGTANEFKTSLGAILNLAYVGKNYKIAFKNIYTHLFTNETTVYYGPITGFGRDENTNRNYISSTLINDMLHNGVQGEHTLGKRAIKIDWSGDVAHIRRDQPDTRYAFAFRGPDDPEGYYALHLGEKTGFLGVGTSMFNSGLKEKRYNGNVNVTIPFVAGTAKQKVKIGYAGAYRTAAFESVGLLYTGDQGGSSSAANLNEIADLPDYELLGSEYMKPGYLTLYPTGPNSSGGAEGEDYSGEQKLHAGYAMLDAVFLKNFRFIGGVRLEQNRVEVNTITYRRDTGGAVDSIIVYDNKDWLPSANLIYSITEKANIRLAYSQTLSRPDFRERSPFVYYEFKERTVYSGAKALRDARITNLDLRYEYYIAAGEVFSVSGFYKKFDSPVELVVGGNPSGQTYYYFNLRSSTAFGVEVDLRKSLGFIDRGSAFWSRVIINGNATWMKANVGYNTQEMLNASNGVSSGNSTTLPPDSRNRPLQGLSPYVYNAGIGYFGKVAGINISYNTYGRRIVAGGLYPYQDQYENPRDVLDLQLSARLLSNKLDARLNISDLLCQPFIVYDNVQKNGISPNAEDLRENVNDDPKGTKYNPDLDYTRYKSYRGSNVSLSLIYHL